jgi:hypothetical protein
MGSSVRAALGAHLPVGACAAARVDLDINYSPGADNQELDVIELRSIEFTQELHRVRAHLLHYASLLDDFCNSVEFVRDTPNPAMSSDPNRFSSKRLLAKECKNLLIQIERLSASRVSWDSRLQNIMQLVGSFSQFGGS